MEALTAWVKPPPQVGGLDHLAVQAPCINIYGRMLPGITNVTDRARYYAFYPWVIWVLDNAGRSRYDDHFVELFRRAVCLFTLIAERHAIAAGGEYEVHAGAMVGSNTLVGVARDLGENGTVRLSDYARREGAKQRYFMNRLGGLGQYYLGVLRELNVLDGDTARGIRYTRQVGQLIAERMDAGVERKLFLDLVEGDVVTTQQLDTLSDFCPCRLHANQGEQMMLSDLFFVRGHFSDVEALPRRRTLQSLLFLASALAQEGGELAETTFRGCMYTAALPGGAPWNTPESLQGNRSKWATYARNELLSLATQGLFFALLDAYEESGLRFTSSQGLVAWFLGQPEARSAIEELGAGVTFADLVRYSAGWLPEIRNWQNPEHEVQLAESLARLCKKSKSAANRRQILVNALKVLIALASRSVEGNTPYGELVFQDDYFRYYPINLRSLSRYAKNDWAGLETEALLGWLLRRWGVDVHLRVALRKLRGQSRSTFRLRPSDRGLEVIGVPPAIHTRPRFNQAVRVLKDVGALTREDSGNWRPSELGTEIMELGDGP